MKKMLGLFNIALFFLLLGACVKDGTHYQVTFKDYDGSILKEEMVKSGKRATAPSSPSQIGYDFTGWDIEFSVVRSDLIVTAQYQIKKYQVIFKNYDGNQIGNVQDVEYGKAAVLPDEPYREGYTFTGWLGEYQNVISSREIVATFGINLYKVVFKDTEDNILKEEFVEHGKNATAPNIPYKEGYTFAGWLGEYQNVISAREIVATFEINIYKVIFKDAEDNILKEEFVEHGKNATAPNIPNKIGYDFVRWSTQFEQIQNDLTVVAEYKIRVYQVTFKDDDGSPIGEPQQIEHGENVIIPDVPLRKGYQLIGWRDQNDVIYVADIMIENETVLTAVWERILIKIDLTVENAEYLNYGYETYEQEYTINILLNNGYEITGSEVCGASYEWQENILKIYDFIEKQIIITLIATPKSALPIISINTFGNEIKNKEDYVTASFRMDNASEYDISEKSLGIRLRGNSTLTYPKKPYRLKFDKKISMLGSEAFKSWVLLADWLDISHIKNYAAYNLASRLEGMHFAPMAEHVNVYLNNAYLGVYLLTDQVQENAGRVGVEDSIVGTDTSVVPFLVELDHYAQYEGTLGVDYFQIRDNFFNIKYPESGVRGNAEQFQYIYHYISEVDILIRSDGNWEDYIDLESFIDYYLAQELMGQAEINWKSIYMSKTLDGKLKMGPVWDFDWAAGGPISYHESGGGTGFPSNGFPTQGWYSSTNWFAALLKSPRFVLALSERWNHIQTILQNWLEDLQNYQGYIQLDVERELSLWNRYENTENERLTFAGQYHFVLNYIMDRQLWMQTAIQELSINS